MADDKITIWMTGRSHLDMAWLWQWEETAKDIGPETFKTVLEQMERIPDLTFSDSQMLLYDAVEKTAPKVFEQVRERIAEGRWELLGGMWVEPDANMPCGESFVRQLLIGQRACMEMFGKTMRVGYLPDTFGFCWTLPQIYKKAGIDYFIHKRCVPDNKLLYWWTGADGTKILTATFCGQHNVNAPNFDVMTVIDPELKGTPFDINVYAEIFSGSTGLKDVLFSYGRGDHGGGLTKEDADKIEELRKDESTPEMKYATFEAFFDKIVDGGTEFPSHESEVNFQYEGCYTSQARVKHWNRRMENLLLATERIAALSKFYNQVGRRIRKFFPWRTLHEAWKLVLLNQFHDILPGSSVPAVYVEAEAAYEKAEERVLIALEEAMAIVAGRIDTSGNGWPFVVFNVHGWEQAGPVQVSLTIPEVPENPAVRTTSGEILPAQIESVVEYEGMYEVEVEYTARKVPSVGYATHRLVCAGEVPVTDLEVTEKSLENEFFRVEVSPESGCISRIFDKRAQREVLSGEGNYLIALGDKAKGMSAWNIDLTGEENRVEGEGRVEVLESGPVRATLRTYSRFRDSRFIQDITLYDGVPRIDFNLVANWYERNQLLKVCFDANIEGGKAVFDIPYGNIERPADGHENPALKWIDLSNSEYGVSLLNDCRYGFDVTGSTLRMSVLRGPTTPDPHADMGRHEIRYALYPHEGGWFSAETHRRAEEFNSPLLPCRTMKNEGHLSPEYSCIQIEPANVMIGAIKQNEGYIAADTIVRVHEVNGEEVEAALTFSIPVRTVELDLLENEIGEEQPATATVKFQIGPYEIRSFKVYNAERDVPIIEDNEQDE
ncbi:alpha-mannosidase [Candidatus Hydrogenedentota bacterium]